MSAVSDIRWLTDPCLDPSRHLADKHRSSWLKYLFLGLHHRSADAPRSDLYIPSCSCELPKGGPDQTQSTYQAKCRSSPVCLALFAHHSRYHSSFAISFSTTCDVCSHCAHITSGLMSMFTESITPFSLPLPFLSVSDVFWACRPSAANGDGKIHVQ